MGSPPKSAQRPALQSRLVLTLASTSALALSACASLPHSAPPPVAKAAGAYATSQSFAAPAVDWPADGWWKAYGDPQLNQLVDEALAGSPNMAAARSRIQHAEAEAATAQAGLFPTLEGKASAVESKQSYHLGIPPQFVPKGYNDVGDLRLNFSWELDFWGKTRSQIAAATSETKASAADAAEARLTLSTAVAATYADLARLFAERDVAERSVQSRLETLDLVSRRVTNGLDTQGELKQAEAGAPAARAELAAIDEQISETRNQLAALLGAGPDRGLAIARPAKASLKAFGLPQNLAADLVGRRPDVAAARWRAEAAAKRIGVAKAQFYPDVNLAGFAGYESLYLRELFKSGSGIGQAGPAITLPIFEGGRLRANLKGAEADYASAVASYDGAVTQAFREVADAAAAERSLTTRLKESRDALAGEEEAYRVARLRYEGGLANYQSVLIAEDRVLESRRTVVDLEARAFTLDVQLVKSLGGGFADAGQQKLSGAFNGA
ncbi:efflux transporter outer membrane subunit [Phenylobacterium montanum]|uniref:Efflux transporter outer membrane subunit n=1 Tax=Phenylobacterium montanum TaxID=2823693 RepID=A0A975IW51_9CAUL|nr:efflux transporter outer membrane subunit [Caulobacter sp. S6]QUD88021.1 efflux transporter outer membrane subunit [Caulobacter sp. S6]